MMPATQCKNPWIVAVCVTLLTGILMPIQARGGLMITVDPVGMTYRLTGSDTFAPFGGDESDFAQWTHLDGMATGAPTQLDNSVATAAPNTLALTRLRLFDHLVDLILDWGVSGVGEQTVLGDGLIYSYAGATATQKNYLQSIIGQTLTPYSIAADPIPVVAVPEPASAALLVLGVTAMLMRRRPACAFEKGMSQ
ncbi:MAG: PEP-CTERM sorting domain-containing protein [Phycisphaera sp.]|nr:PEP-CTERM sorting domain-containing protein [Phycisphaera sp.]